MFVIELVQHLLLRGKTPEIMYISDGILKKLTEVHLLGKSEKENKKKIVFLRG